MKISVKTLGCKVNQYESEMIKEQFQKRGYSLAGENDEADVFVVNTCSVTNLSDRKARQMIRLAKKQNPNAVMVVTGCYSQIKPQEVLALSEVDIVTGTNSKGELADLVEEFLQKRSRNICREEPALNEKGDANEKLSKLVSYEELLKSEYAENGIVTAMDARSRAYIKIEDGCNRYCSYCIIPYARGRVRSRNIESIVEEARCLLEKGFKEIVLTGINTALYGSEKGTKEFGLVEILRRLEELPYDFRIRLSSLEPTVVNHEQVSALLRFKKLCPHLHLSIQSGSDDVIKSMNRHYTREDYMKIVEMLRGFDKGFGITTDMIVGFPGESEDDFRDSLDLVARAEFVKVHAFRFSKRSGTVAEKMAEQIRGDIKNSRVQELMGFSDKVAKGFLKKQIGTIRTILCEIYENGYIIGYTENYIRTYVPLDEERADACIGSFLRVRLSELFNDGMLGKEEEIE